MIMKNPPISKKPEQRREIGKDPTNTTDGKVKFIHDTRELEIEIELCRRTNSTSSFIRRNIRPTNIRKTNELWKCTLLDISKLQGNFKNKVLSILDKRMTGLKERIQKI